MPQLTHELIARAVRPPPPGPSAPPPDEARLRAEMKVFLHGRDPELGIWVFAYGALMWSHAEAAPDIVTPARLPGFARHYALQDVHDRGTPAAPGLTLGLGEAPALSCSGLLLHLPGPDVEARLWPVWKQEMGPGFYRPSWQDVVMQPRRESAGTTIRALCFITRPDCPAYRGELPVRDIAECLAASSGSNGSAAAYLLDAAETLRQNGMRDPMLESMEAEVARRLAGIPHPVSPASTRARATPATPDPASRF
ncbi:gamma-glutamylcyclotransferase [Roseomonas sp. SSH11]|uniref:glutathione-specific gamma-glutamylcyclotransferase n=1 Tax=Pararoseomonas baculiformis TaxID=2820812 RepID=A0ABS4A9Q5_9PROT|nr:gamma-glutamylcyclotransferase [Pararoseomonas baculiformis]MBP0443734.1 gamma-glutamylcyclotransferase [Pararoseomonas baculiformis]